ncbi:MAG: glycosyltransferase family 39 protein [Burkholderiales bacterium]|nr:glycosyltransferase family 39 protein [Bacteroidia bacterium]
MDAGNTNYRPFYLFTFAVITFLVLPFLLQDGMFMDGVQYACVSKNLADGKGSFWFPILSRTWSRQNSLYFMEHPPLFYGIESLFFKLFGSSIYTERIFSFSLLLSTAFFIHMIWKISSTYVGQHKTTSWFPVILWIITPVCFWTYQNHMIETLLSVFTLASVYFTLRGLFKEKYKVPNFVLSGALIYCAFLTKGFPGLFPLVAVPLFYVTLKRISLKEALFYTGVVLLTFIVIYVAVIITNHHAKESLEFYLTKRLLNRIEVTSTINYRLFILRDLFFEFLPSVLICLVLCFFSRKQRGYTSLKSTDKQLFLFMLLLGFSGSVPLMITMVQKNFYLVPSIPFFALSLAYINSDFIHKQTTLMVLNPKYRKRLNIAAFVMLITVLLFSGSQMGKISRDESLLNEVRVVGNYLQKEELVGVDPETYLSWSFQFYLLRNHDIQLDPKNKFRKYFITKTSPELNEKYQYTQISLPTNEYKLYRLN